MRYDPLRYFYRFFAFVLFRRIFVSFKMVNDYEQVLPEDWDAFLQEDAALDYVRQIVNCFDESALELALRLAQGKVPAGTEPLARNAQHSAEALDKLNEVFLGH